MGNFKKVRYGPESYMGFNRPGSGNWKDFDHPVINRWIEDQKAGRGSQMTYNFLLFNDHASIDDLGGANNRWYPSLTGPTGAFPGCWPFCDGHVTCCTGPTCATGYNIPGCCEPFQRCFDIPDDDDEEIPPDGGGDIDDIPNIDDGPEPQDGLINDYSLKFDGTSRAEAHGIMSDLSSATTGTIIISFKSSNFYNIPTPKNTTTKHELFKFYDSQDENGRTIELWHGWDLAYNAWELTYAVIDSEGLTVNKTRQTFRKTDDITPGDYPLQNETWHQIAIVQSNNGTNMYTSFFMDGQNGVPYTNGINYDLNYWFADFTQEKRPLDKFRVGHNFKGKIDEVAIWDTALSESEIESIYLDSVATGPTCPTGNREVRDLSGISNGPIGWWRMGDESITGPISESFDPSSLTSLIAWYDASDSSTITDSGGAITSWADKSGNNNDLTRQGNPVTGSSTQNSLNVIDLDGDDYFTKNNFPNPTSGDLQAIIVCEPDQVNASSDAIISQAGSGRTWQLDAGNSTEFRGKLQVAGQSKQSTSVGSGAITGFNIFCASLDLTDDGKYEFLLNGELRNGTASRDYTAAINSSLI